MGWGLGYDDHWQRDVGYMVPAHCDYPGCRRVIDRGLGYVCGGEPYGGDTGCGLYFCEKHLHYQGEGPQRCARCCARKKPFIPTPDHKRWTRWKMKHWSWWKWRADNGISEPKRILKPEASDLNHHQYLEYLTNRKKPIDKLCA